MSNLPVKTSHERHRSHSNDWICLFQVVFSLGSLLVLVLLRHLLDRLPPSSPQQLPPLRRQPGLDDHLSNAQGETRCQVLIFIFPSGVPSFPSVWHDKPCLLDQPHQVSCLKTIIEPLECNFPLFFKNQWLLPPSLWCGHRGLGWNYICLFDLACDGRCL